MSQSTGKARKKLSPIESFKKIFYSKINLFLFFVPVGYVVHFLNLNAILVFIANSLAVISLGYRLNELTYYFEELEQEFSSTIAQLITAVLTLACISLVLPAAFSVFIQKSSNDIMVLRISYGTSMLYTHKKLFKLSREGEEHIDTITSLILLAIMAVIMFFSAIFLVNSIDGIVGISKTFIGLILLPIVCHIAKFITIAFVDIEYIEFEKICRDCKEKMEKMATKNVNNAECDKCKEFNLPECKKRMKATTILSSKSSIRTALLTTPILVILGWIISKPMSLNFPPFQTICVVIAVILKNYLIQMANQIG
ncbi:20400_t:CDS:2 [Dentiscutata erythropus]|uniref:20400_t:CDS:1 n=1 Tax=Dentiscutata erythropus TaxID=1348616 RepID=A0A9N9FY09_9GLOM|nr:20400_t:CDS:2 [Dentiscutata erythropus]